MDAAGLPARLDARLARGRDAAEARMTDTCKITRPGDGDPEFNHETGQYDDPAPVTVYEGPCYIPRRAAASTQADAGEAAWQVGEFPLALPVDGSAAVHVNHTVNYLTSRHDPALVGNVYGITAEPDQSQATARRFRMKRVTGS